MAKKKRKRVVLRVRRKPKTGPQPITTDRKLVTRVEAARIIGCSVDTVKRLEKRRGGELDVIKLNGMKSTTFYQLAQLTAVLSRVAA